jgi:hypothetical protein
MKKCKHKRAVMARKAVYLLVTKSGASAEQQRALIRKAVKLGPHDEEYIDDLTEPYRRRDKPLEQRATALKHLRRGDLLVVATPGGLGVGRDDIRTVLLELARSGNGLLDAQSGKTVIWSEQVADALEFLDRATLERKRGAAATAREARIALGYVHIPEQKKLAVSDAQARQMWYDRVAYPSPKDVAEACGVSARTLYNRFGSRMPTPALKRKRRA